MGGRPEKYMGLHPHVSNKQEIIDRGVMKNITIAVPEPYIRNIALLQEVGSTPSRSECIRQAIIQFLQREAETCRVLEVK